MQDSPVLVQHVDIYSWRSQRRTRTPTARFKVSRPAIRRSGSTPVRFRTRNTRIRTSCVASYTTGVGSTSQHTTNICSMQAIYQTGTTPPKSSRIFTIIYFEFGNVSNVPSDQATSNSALYTPAISVSPVSHW